MIANSNTKPHHPILDIQKVIKMWIKVVINCSEKPKEVENDVLTPITLVIFAWNFIHVVKCENKRILFLYFFDWSDSNNVT